MKKEVKGFFKEFKEFISQGNVMSLAIGVIIGGAFQKIVTSAINDVIMPFVGLITGKESFNDRFLILSNPDNIPVEDITSIAVAKELKVSTFNYGSFISAIIDFLIMALVIFLLVKLVTRVTTMAKGELIKDKETAEEVPALPEIKTCPYCLSEIPYAAVKCKNCTSDVPNEV